ncbi:MAG: AAC(3) family N-acetyltransferase [Victivallaceae bacterium]
MITKAQLQKDLKKLGIKPTDTLLIHSSLKSIGDVEGGGEAVLDALIEYFDPAGGLLVLPTLSYNLNAEKPVYSVERTPSIVGVLTELFRKRPGVIRSLHPTHSVAAAGRDAASFVAGHETFDSPGHRNSPWGRLIDRKAKILFIGTGIGCNTFLHAVEEQFNPLLGMTEIPEMLYSVDAGGKTVEVPSRRHNNSHSRFYAKLEPVFDAAGILKRGKFGDANCHLLEAKATAELVTKLLQKELLLFTHPRLPVSFQTK